MSSKGVHPLPATSTNGTPAPHIIVCHPNAWDQRRIQEQNVSFEMVSYLTYVLYPFSSNPLLFEGAEGQKRLWELERRWGTIFPISPLFCCLLNN